MKKRYTTCLEKGIEENHSTKHKYAKREEKTLLTRLEKYRENHLLFLKRFEVPFDNNMSERDLRKVKNRPKMAGGFRKEKAQKQSCAQRNDANTKRFACKQPGNTPFFHAEHHIHA